MDKERINILDYIPIGHKNAITREALASKTGLSDRKIRMLISEQSNEHVQVINVQDGKGYFIPSPEDTNLIRIYSMQERQKAMSILKRISALDRYYKKLPSSKGHPIRSNDYNIEGQISLF